MTRFGCVMTTYFSVMVFIGSAFVHPAPRLIWNASASTPTGLYAVRPTGELHAPNWSPSCRRSRSPASSADGGYLPRGVPLMKRVLALPGQTVCRAGLHHHHRSHRRRRGASARPSRPRSARLDRLPDPRAERGLPHEPGRPGQPGRPVFRPAARQLDRRSRGSRCGPTKAATAASCGAPRRD